MPTISHDEVRAVFGRLEATLESDALFALNGDEKEAKANLAEIKKILKELPATVEEFFAKTLKDASESSRYAGLRLYALLVEQYGVRRPTEHRGDLILKNNEVKVYRGDLRVTGNIILGRNSVIIAAGDMIVEGNITGIQGAYCLVAASAAMRARSVMISGQLYVGGSTIIGDIVYLDGPHHSARVKEIRARTIMENLGPKQEARARFGLVRAQQHFKESLATAKPDRLKAIGRILGVFGATSSKQLITALRSKL